MNVLRFIQIAVLTFFLGACSEDFLDLAPISNSNINDFYQNESDFQTAVNASYQVLHNLYDRNHLVFGELRSDNIVAGSTGGGGVQVVYFDIDAFRINPQGNGPLNNFYSDSYTGISRCNIIIGRIGGIELDDAIRNQLTGEAKFLRALYYFNLVRMFGDVPLVDYEFSSVFEGFDIGRSPVSDVYTLIEQDLVDAGNLLPPSYSGNDIGRATEWAAKALLGKVYLTRQNYSGAISQLNEVLGSNHTLLGNYADIFTPDNKNNAEIIFDAQFLGRQLIAGSSIMGALFTANAADSLLGIANASGLLQPADVLVALYESEDLRRDVSVIEGPGFAFNANNSTFDGIIYKYFDPLVTNINDADLNIPIIRYADVLLMLAEALNEQGFQASGDAFNYMNQVRARAGLATLSSTDLPDQSTFRDAVAKERRIELAFEGHRWFDLVRTGKAIEVMNGLGFGFDVDANKLVYPIPQSQIDVNPELMVQNPGY